jgi:large subunit ribosomal protein L25
MDQPVLAARVRKSKGKGAARKLRMSNQIPAIFYGPKTEPIMLAVDYPELERILSRGTGDNVILDLQMQLDHGTEIRKVIVKDLLINPVNDTCLHADFYEISMDREITVDIPIRLKNTPIGVINGGILQHIKRQLTISCLPGKVMDALELDVSGLDIGNTLHIEDIELPEGVKSEEEGRQTVAVVAAPTVVAEEAEEEVIEEEAVEEEKAESETEKESSDES